MNIDVDYLQHRNQIEQDLVDGASQGNAPLPGKKKKEGTFIHMIEMKFICHSPSSIN